MPLSLVAFSGIGWITPQCSTTLPFSSLKISTMALPRVPGSRTACNDDVIAVGEDALDLAAVVRELVLQEGDEALEAFPAVGRQRIVLGVAGAEILQGFLEVLLVERGVVEGGDDLLVLLHLLGIGGKRRGACDQQRKGRGEYRAKHLNLLCRSYATSHARRQPQRDDREGDQNHQPNEVGHDER